MEEVALQEDRYNGRRRRWIYRLKHNAGNESLEACFLHHMFVLEVLFDQTTLSIRHSLIPQSVDPKNERLIPFL
jgi:hypothetical protein